MTLPARDNNFDLIRLLAALQVAWYHGSKFLGPVERGPILGTFDTLSTFFPGVPVFFFLSGFLISMSYERAPSLASYTLNRVVRIYPALWTCLVVSILVIAVMGGWAPGDGVGRFARWITAQATIAQFYNGGVLPQYGSGVPNGALWTISVELQFYALVPVLFLLLGAPGHGNNRWRWLLLTVGAFALSLALRGRLIAPETDVWKLVKVSVVPYLYAFGAGITVRAFLPSLAPLLEGRFLAWLLLHLGVCVTVVAGGGEASILANTPHPATVLTLCGLTFSGAWTWPTLSQRLLRSQDYSYGIYIYHMVVINVLIELNLRGTVYVSTATALACLCGFVSWQTVEKHALRLKPYTLRAPASSVN